MNIKIKTLILFSILILVLAGQVSSSRIEPKIYYKLNLEYNNKIILNSMDIEFLDKEIKNQEGIYSAYLFDFNGKIIESVFFDISDIVFVDKINEEGEVIGGEESEANKTFFEIYIPYNENAKEIVVYDNKINEVLREDVSEYSKLDSKIIKDDIKSENNDKNDNTEKSETKYNLLRYWWVLGVVVIILVILIIYFVKKKK